jgi:hypothetical protein
MILGERMPPLPGTPQYFRLKLQELLALSYKMKRAPTIIVTITTSAADENLLLFLRIMNGGLRPVRAKDDLVMSTIYYEFRAKQMI